MNPKYTLPELVAGINPVNVHDEVDFGADVGLERAQKAEVAQYFTARGSRTTLQRAKELLERIGTTDAVRDGDQLEVE